MLTSDSKSKIIDELAKSDIICTGFIEIVSMKESYPNYNISAIFEGHEITLKLMSCVLDKSYNILGMKLEPDGKNRDEIVNFSVSLQGDNLHIFNNFIQNKYLEQELNEVDKINKDFPFDVDYEIALFYDSFCFVTGTMVYVDRCYELKTISNYPTFTVGAYAHNPTAAYYSKGKLLLKFHKNGYRISYNYMFTPIDDIKPLRLKLFQELFLYYMDKTKFKINVLEMDEMLLLNYDDLIAYITVQKMVDI